MPKAKPALAPSPPRIIETEADIKEGIAHLRLACRHLKKAHDLAGDPPLRRNIGGFTGLARIIVGQQVSIQAAASIWSKVETGLGKVTPQNILTRDDDAMRALGLSRPKIKTMRAISQAVVDKSLPITKFDRMAEADIRNALTAVSGVGPWTADIYLMFCMGRADQFAPGDLALQIAAGMIMKKDPRPSADELELIAQKRWSPWRGVAARLLWHYYAVAKAREKTGTPI
jgi:DNA-3-methyladenine glycosylase II